jgi:amino acid adenylation domain-containing protein
MQNSSSILSQEYLAPISLRFLRSVLMFPKNNALFVDNTYYTYQQLWKLVDFIYHKIPTDKTYYTIGIYCNNDIFTYASILAVNLYGAAYVPLNNKFPASRNRNYAEQCGLRLVLSSTESDDLKVITKNLTVVYTNVEEGKNIQKKLSDTHYKKAEQHTAYILFTSGTTGHPKGVPVSHSNVAHFFNFFLSNYSFNENDKFLQVYELTFDVSVFSFFMPLMVGACCYVLPVEGVKIFKIIDYLQKFDITVVSMVPSVLRYVAPYLSEIELAKLRYSFFSGDALLHELAVKWSKSLPNAIIHNFYGPTETTIVCTRYVFEEEKSKKESVNGIVPLGKLFEGMIFLIVDEDNMIINKGELCISGTQVIPSYLNKKNEDRFIEYNNIRYYKTGDVVSVNNLGNLVFYGRTDSQVKIDGYRIELTEIENAISIITDTAVVVIYQSYENAANHLIAYLETRTINENLLKEKLIEILPAYMIPKHFVAVEKFTLNANGKIDKKNLPHYIF